MTNYPAWEYSGSIDGVIYIYIDGIIFFSDNIFSTKSWIKNKFCFEDSVIDKQFEIPPDLDYIE